MYFTDRIEAGQRLAAAMAGKIPPVNRTVIALSDGSVIVGEQVAKAIHASLMLFGVEAITLPGELSPMAALSQAGSLTYNSAYSAGEINEFTMEYNSFIQEERRRKMFKLNRDSRDSQIPPGLLRKHVVVLVADGLPDSFLIDAAADYLKPYKIHQLIIATPFATVKAVDRMHLLADQLFCLDIIDNYISTDHYYDSNAIPPHEELVRNIHLVTLKWSHPPSSHARDQHQQAPEVLL